MRKNTSKSEAKLKIDEFFKKTEFNQEEMRKLKRLAMKYKIQLGDYKKSFCKKCLSQLKGKIKISKTHKTVICMNCGSRNKFKIK